ncbi:MAG: branched-chain amino acid ABC transporter substrate-binding protein [Betaproteobacteria bacterium RIFCSPLOWO2_02_FULL_67_26]|nr:MAG: branched-chain amino acid ABC transporter substrate-binding protein [Betaproteobacteria bacterium RIFCSPLOWO2_02_FULL_67_26]
MRFAGLVNKLLVGAALLCAATASAQTIKIGVINTYSGPFATLGDLIDKGFKLYMKQNAAKLPPGVKIELVIRDAGGPNPDKAKQLAQELIVRDKIQILTGVVFTPNAMAIAPLTQEAKLPFFIMNAGTSVITTRSPYIARFSFTLWQSTYPLGAWASRKYKTAYIAVSDFAPGHDSEAGFERGFTEGGGKIVGKVRIPLANPDFVPFMQRAKDARPDVVFSFIPAGRQATQIMKAYGDLGLGKAGVKFIGPGDITTDEELPNMGDLALGVITMHHYSAAATRPANKAFIAAWKKEYGEKSWPSFMSVGAWDAMDAIYYVIREQKGRIDPDRTMALVKQYKNPNSPRGPIAIDPATRDIIQNEYMREVRKVGGQLANVEFETFAQVKDPWKELQKK